MNILVINCGSSSLKYQLIDIVSERAIAKGACDRIGLDKSNIKHAKGDGFATLFERDLPDHATALAAVVELLLSPEHGVISDVGEISAIGHRVVHGAEKFSESCIITEEALNAIKECASLAPLHNPPNVIGIEACMKLMPGAQNVAVFDTAFHQTMPPRAYVLPLPYEYFEKQSIRKYGFHGTSHRYVANRAAAMLDRPIETLKLVTCHLGNGSSICAVDGGKSIETSMGFTPLDGIMMGTRSGSVDPAVVMYIMEKSNMDIRDVIDMMNKKSGMLGISGVSSDFRDVTAAADQGNARAQLALEMFTYQARKYIGQYAAAMGGIDAVVFTAGVGENVRIVRSMTVKGLEFLGLAIDPDKNKVRSVEADISAKGSKARVLVVPTNEELAIARDTFMLMQ